MSIVAESLRIHTNALKVIRGVRGVYRRGSDQIEITGIPGRSASVGDVVSDMPVLDSDCEWLFDPADLELNGERFTPRERDEWIADIGVDKIRFKVLPSSQGEDVYSWSNGDRTLLRVSMKSRGADGG